MGITTYFVLFLKIIAHTRTQYFRGVVGDLIERRVARLTILPPKAWFWNSGSVHADGNTPTHSAGQDWARWLDIRMNYLSCPHRTSDLLKWAKETPVFAFSSLFKEKVIVMF